MKTLTTKAQWLEWLQKIHAAMKEISSNEDLGPYEIVASMFGLTTYDSDMDETLVKMMMPTLISIGAGTNGAQMHDAQKYLNFCITVNMPFLQNRLDWGTSVRGAWYHFSDRPFDPHVGLVGTGSRGLDIIDAAPIVKGEETRFVQLIAAVEEFLGAGVLVNPR